MSLKKVSLLLVPVLAIGFFAGYRFLTREQPIKVTVQAVDRGLVEATVANTRAGTVKARNRANLTPPIGGQIATLHVRKADTVKAGQILLTLWNKDLQAELQLARSETIAAEAAVRENCLMADLAERQAARQRELRTTKATSESKYDEAQATARARRAACEAATARRAVSAARVKATEATLERTILIAPFDGIVAEVNGEVGEYLTPSPPGIATLPAVDLINMQSLYVAAPIDEIDAAQIRPGMAVRISLDAFPKQSFPGTVHSISPYVLEVAKQARTVEIEADFAQNAAPPNLLAGYSADVEIILATRPQVMRIPSEALLGDGSVYLLDPKSKRVERRRVTTGLANWKFTEVSAGLQPGETVVTSIDRQGLADGVLVEVEQPARTVATP
ncbi:efflux transporter, RND family, MFP subunit [Desulfobulbus propionicus DSM 2032]|uniref:Efflux transporter, RND family, MFP subunit n=1 Tax=Desulfobulbus propionicus (strain ATCC 33891 / DSM 2032 / VKM B-1956 / 1pr3) TaxID=577650 RepID=A0A7U3YMK3_DESPD|nr:efflux RND transporter periplasmic adaptor subunit [Desulfobulbus propionicus]ADW18139.1 efflux transporter, RND family, MFP subunit [Desulfobulbus propionicus DSM 2032]